MLLIRDPTQDHHGQLPPSTDSLSSVLCTEAAGATRCALQAQVTTTLLCFLPNGSPEHMREPMGDAWHSAGPNATSIGT